MRSKERIRPTLKIIESFWEKNPDLRLTQVLVVLWIVPNSPWRWFYKEWNILFDDQDHIPVRDYFLLWTYWKDWKWKIQYRLLSKMSNAHLWNIIDTQQLTDDTRNILQNELDYRKENNIFIAD